MRMRMSSTRKISLNSEAKRDAAATYPSSSRDASVHREDLDEAIQLLVKGAGYREISVSVEVCRAVRPRRASAVYLYPSLGAF